MVRIRFKIPTSAAEFEIEARLEDSTAQLKQRVQVEFQSHPRVEQQRLIFAGQELRDNQLLSQVLEKVRSDTRPCRYLCTRVSSRIFSVRFYSLRPCSSIHKAQKFSRSIS